MALGGGGAGTAAARVSFPAAKGLCNPAPIPVEPGAQATASELSRLGQDFTLTIWRLGCDEQDSYVIFTVDPDASAPFVCSASLIVSQQGQADPRFKLVQDPLGDAASQCGDVTAATSFALVPRTTSTASIDLQQALVVTWDFGDSIRTLQVPAYDPSADPDRDPDPTPEPEDLVNEGGVTGVFFDPQSPGQGFNFNFGDSGLTIFFYGQTADGDRLWLISETVVLDLQYGVAEELDLFEVLGGTFGAPVDQLQPWGTLTLTLDTCDQGQAILDGLDGTQTLNLVRLSGVLGAGCDGVTER